MRSDCRGSVAEDMVNKENKYIPGVYKNPSNYETIKVYIVVPGDPYDASILGVFRIRDRPVRPRRYNKGQAILNLSLLPYRHCAFYDKIHSGRVRDRRSDPDNL